MDQEDFKKAAEHLVVHVEAFIATMQFPSDAVRCASVLLVMDGSDGGAQEVYRELHASAPAGQFPMPPLPADQIFTGGCPYKRLKECATRCGYAIGPQQDKDPPPNSVRVAAFTKGSVMISTWYLTLPRPGSA